MGSRQPETCTRIDTVSFDDGILLLHPLHWVLTAVLYWPMLYIGWLAAGDGYRIVRGIGVAQARVRGFCIAAGWTVLVLFVILLVLGHAEPERTAFVVSGALTGYMLFHVSYLRPQIARMRRRCAVVRFFDAGHHHVGLADATGLVEPYFRTEFFPITVDERILIVRRVAEPSVELVLCNYTEDLVPVEVVDCSPTSISLRLLCSTELAAAAGVQLDRPARCVLTINCRSDQWSDVTSAGPSGIDCQKEGAEEALVTGSIGLQLVPVPEEPVTRSRKDAKEQPAG